MPLLTRIWLAARAFLHRESMREMLFNTLTEIRIMSPALQKITDDVAQMKQVNASAVTLLQGLSQQIRDMKDDPAALEALAADIEASTASLAAAVTANTPAAPPAIPNAADTQPATDETPTTTETTPASGTAPTPGAPDSAA